MDINALIEKEAREQHEDQIEAKHEYRDWLVDNDCTAIVPTYWHGRALASRPGLPTYHSRLGRVTIPEND